MEAKKAIQKIFLFLLPLAVIFAYVEYRLSKIPNTYSQKRIDIERSKDSIQVLFLGGSQILLGVNPVSMSAKGFNLADYDQTLYYDEQLAYKYTRQMPALKLVVISINYFSLYYILQHSPEPWRAFYYSRFWDIRPVYLSKWDARDYSYLFLYTPYVSMSYVMKRFKVNLAENMNDYGYVKNDTAHNALNVNDSIGKGNVKIHDGIIDANSFQQNLQDLEDLITDLQKSNIKVVFISPPVSPTYSKYCNTSILEKNKKTIEFLNQNFHTTYFDYANDQRFSKPLFQDNFHLNFIGAEKFSRIIDKDIVAPMFNQRQVRK